MTEPIPTRHHDCEVLIVGGGAAATMAAFECADAGVAVIQASKGRATSGTTTVARGGFAAAMGKGDSPEQHLAEILEHGGDSTNSPGGTRATKSSRRSRGWTPSCRASPATTSD